MATRILLTITLVLLALGSASCVTTQASSKSDAELAFDAAKKHYDKKQYEGAAAAFGKVVADYPDSPLVEPSLYYQGSALAFHGDTDQALLILGRVVKNGTAFNDVAQKRIDRIKAAQ